MSKKTKIELIKISVRGKEFELTPDEVKELKSILNELFPEPAPAIQPQPIIIKERVYEKPWKYWNPVWVGDKTSYTPSQLPKKQEVWITCKNDSSSTYR